jgi:thioredoxin reductase (NADPH)
LQNSQPDGFLRSRSANTYDLRSIAFPRLSDDQLAVLGSCPLVRRKHYSDGEKLIETGQREFEFFVVLAGEVVILDESSDPPNVVVVHGPGEFTGDVAHLTGASSVISAVARGDCEVYVVPSESLRELLNRSPELGDLILQAFIARRQLLNESGRLTGVRVLGSRYSRDTFRIRDFLARNRVYFTWLDLETDPHVKALLTQFGIGESETPVVAWAHKLLLRNPSERELAEALGLRRRIEHRTYDLVVVGAGPAGLAAAVYGASEGLSTLVLERRAPGGQASMSMRIENYLGFPTGITGAELTDRATVQAGKFGTEMAVATGVVGLEFEDGYPMVQLDGGETVAAKCLLIATGAEYRRLPAEGCERYEGNGVYYAATYNEAQMCRNAEAVVVGGGNSAGQAAVFLATQAREVYVVIRHADLYRDMSAYLVKRIEDTPNIEVLRNTEVRRMLGNHVLRAVELVNRETGEVRVLETAALFSFIGAQPRTEWLPSQLARDEKGFVLTGRGARSSLWTERREPFLLETSHPGVFAAGDVRAGSVKRVASAVGEGAMAVQFVHAYLQER